jgi:hypothetical protein
MEFNAETLLALGGLITGVLGAVGAIVVSKRSARKDEVTLLREEIGRLQEQGIKQMLENEKWRKRYNSLFNYVLKLRVILANNGIEIPYLDEEGGIEESDGSLSPLTTPKQIPTNLKKNSPQVVEPTVEEPKQEEVKPEEQK